MIRKSVLISALVAVSPGTGMAHPSVELAAETALRGNAGDASRQLARLSPDQLQATDQSFQQCMVSRFDSRKPEPPSSLPSDPFVRGVLSAYQTYWHSALRNPEKEPLARKTLGSRLMRLAQIGASDADRPTLRNLSSAEHQTLRTLSFAGGGSGNPGFDVPSYLDLSKRSVAQERQASEQVSTLDALSPLLRQRLSDLGYFSIERESGSLRDLILWGKQTTQRQEVQVGNEPREVTVVYLDDVYSLGWKDYATCSRNAPEGWLTSTDSLYVVVGEPPAMASQTSSP